VLDAPSLHIGRISVRIEPYSVVVPVRVTDQYLSRSLESISEQTVPPSSTYVVINGTDGSTCPSSEVCAGFDFVTPIFIQELGMVPAVVHGITMVAEEVVMFLDSDDLWVADKAERQLTLLQQQTDVDAVSSRTQNFRELDDGSCVDLASEIAGLLGATAFRTNVFTRFGGIDPKASHFTFLYRWWENARKLGIVEAPIESVGLRRRVHANSGWVSQTEHGKNELLREIRRITRAQNAERSHK